MAKAPAAPMPTDDDAAPPDGDTGGDMEGEGDEHPTVLLTVMDNGDGTYTLIRGDEDEDEGEGGEEGEAADEAAGTAGAPPAAGAPPMGEPGEGEGEGQTFDSAGALLKGILDMLKDHEAEQSGEGTEDDNFSAGFAGGSAASPPKPSPMTSKY